MKIITQKELQCILRYEPDSGNFIRLTRTSSKSLKGMIAGCEINGYVRIWIKSRSYQAHQLIWLYMTGKWPNEIIDHINHNGLDNRWINLREIKKSENLKNAKLYKNNKSGLPGVRWCIQKRKWQANIGINNKDIHLGFYKDFFEACCSRKRSDIKFNFHRNHGL